MFKPSHRESYLWALLFACMLIAPSLAAETATVETTACGPAERAAFLQAANDGVPAEELVDLFAHCAQDGNTDLGKPREKVIVINNALASTFYEQMNGCGYHPQAGRVACDVEIKQPFGFGPFGPPPLGSTEFVDFCFSCPAGAPFVTVQGTVHVTDDITGVAPSWGMMVSAPVPAACGPAGTGMPLIFRATLSWGVPAIAPCTAAPIMVWGNQITFDTRDDP